MSPIHAPETAAGLGDMFLAITGARSGAIKGESRDATHPDEIDVVSWTWGMVGKASLGGGSAAGKAAIQELRIIKRVDSASTPLMSALRTNELITKAVLTLRKAGRSALEFFKITIEQGRVTSITLEAGDGRTNTPEVFENVSFTFNKITVEYVPQGRDGQGRGSMMFQDEFGAS